MCLQEESAGPGIKIRKSAVSGGAHTSASSTRLPRARSNAALPDNQSRATTAVSFVTDNYIAFVILMLVHFKSQYSVLCFPLNYYTFSFKLIEGWFTRNFCFNSDSKFNILFLPPNFILLRMAVLMVLNLVLVYRLSSITSSCNNQFDILSRFVYVN